MTVTIHFPPDFLWGAATSAYQIEGARYAGGKGESIWDRFVDTPGKVKNGDKGDLACDHYHRFKEDIQLMRSLGLQSYRFSISWPRILPEGRGAVQQDGLDFYSRLVDELLSAGILPCATFYHWDLPQALQDAGGWPARGTAEAFVEYADIASRALGDRVKHWITHNEPAVAAWNGYETGEHAPGIQDLALAIRTSHHLLLSHGWAVPVVRENSPDAQVGITLNINWTQAASNSRADLMWTRLADGKWVRWFADPLYGRGYPADMVSAFSSIGALPSGMDFVLDGDLDATAVPTDFLGINYYNRSLVRAQDEDNEPQQVFKAPASPEHWTEMGWENYPDGLLGVLCRVAYEYQPLKIYITENGASYSTGPDNSGVIPDDLRIRYLESHLLAARRAIEAGVPLAGYYLWSFLDNFEWAHGYAQRFGIVYVDFETLERTPKKSAAWYRDVIRRNGLEVASQDSS